MRLFSLVLAVSGVVLLAGCADMVMPRGYNSDPAGPILKPSGVKFDGGWGKMSGYKPAPAAPAPAPQKPMAVSYTKDVTVYPVDGDASPYNDMKFDFANKTPAPSTIVMPAAPQYSVEPAKRLFFAHGSATVSASDNRRLRDLADDVMHASSKSYKIRVVGHASHETGIDDAAKSAALNLKMAQKRADAVADALVKAGLKREWIATSSKGDSADAERRVDVFVDSGQ